jgi:hypothetical protein
MGPVGAGLPDDGFRSNWTPKVFSEQPFPCPTLANCHSVCRSGSGRLARPNTGSPAKEHGYRTPRYPWLDRLGFYPPRGLATPPHGQAMDRRPTVADRGTANTIRQTLPKPTNAGVALDLGPNLKKELDRPSVDWVAECAAPSVQSHEAQGAFTG